MKKEALKLADVLDTWDRAEGAGDLVRRLVEELDEKNYRILELTKRYKALTWNDKQTKPLSDEEIDDVAKNNFDGVGRLIYMVSGNVKGDDFRQAVRSLARAIEAKVRGEK